MMKFKLPNDDVSQRLLATPSWVSQYLDIRIASQNAREESEYFLNKQAKNTSETASKVRGCLLGLALGDALGTTLEFSERDQFPLVTHIVGGGPFRLNAGEWTDDSSMALCLAHSLLRTNGFNAADQMDLYTRWWQEGLFSVNGTCFDIGNTVISALHKYAQTQQPFSGSTHSASAGNGSLMRLAPAALYYLNDPQECIDACGASSRTTHQAAECVDACRYFGGLLLGAIKGATKDELTQSVYEPYPGAWKTQTLEPEVIRVATQAHLKTRDKVSSTGYVIHTLEAALWAFANSRSFEEGAVLAVNLAGDADTVGAVYGQLAGAFYGDYNLDPTWIKKLALPSIFYAYADEILQENTTKNT
ncbi:ADP-ribosyl-[dinitrogen reductase] glycohydrolase [Thalassocella blandensis]|nr:ADP-ribosyl-[dinitrogen reductase] glycohydrolase [Thalassocella blandensis]